MIVLLLDDPNDTTKGFDNIKYIDVDNVTINLYKNGTVDIHTYIPIVEINSDFLSVKQSFQLLSDGKYIDIFPCFE